MAKKIYYYKELPENYILDKEIKSSDKKFIIWANIATLVLLILVFALCLALKNLNPIEINIRFFIIFAACFVLYILYMTLHEITHGIAYKLLTKQKLTFGVKLPVAYCGVKDIYTTKFTAIVAILAPFVTFNIIFIPILFFLNDVAWYVGITFIFASHIAGCCVDVYESILLIFKYKGKEVLMYDTGPDQQFYIKNN